MNIGIFVRTDFEYIDISKWDVSNVENMQYMFYLAIKFNQPIGNWDVSNVTGHFDPFDGCNIEEEYKPNFN